MVVVGEQPSFHLEESAQGNWVPSYHTDPRDNKVALHMVAHS